VKTIGIVSTKGGVGKTTLASALAVRAAQDGKRVALVDLDPQESLAGWLGRRADKTRLQLFHNVDLASEAIEALRLTQAPDYCIIDTPPAHLKTIRDTIDSVDLVLIPLRPGALDLIGTEDAVASAYDAGTSFLCVFNDADARWGGAVAARAYLEEEGVPVANTVIAHRAAYFAAVASGKSGPEVGKDGKAAEEVDALWLEIKASLKKGARS
jgi:chromosome partitioning protein